MARNGRAAYNTGSHLTDAATVAAAPKDIGVPPSMPFADGAHHPDRGVGTLRTGSGEEHEQQDEEDQDETT